MVLQLSRLFRKSRNREVKGNKICLPKFFIATVSTACEGSEPTAEKYVLNIYLALLTYYGLQRYAYYYSTAGNWLSVNNLSVVNPSAVDDEEFSIRYQFVE